MRQAILATVSSLALSLPGVCLADIDLTVGGPWSAYVDEGDLQGGAGTDLSSSLASDPEEVTLEIAGATDSSDAWRVEVRREESPFWDKDLQIEIRRVSDGVGDGSVSGGTTYQVLTSTDAVFFSGEGDLSDVRLQLRITGLSVTTVAPNVSLTHITYSLVDT